MPDDLPFVPDATLDLVDARWWLELRCGCGRSAYVPHKMLAKRHGTRAFVPRLLARLRCQTCKRRPILAQWVSAPVGPPHYPAPKRVPLALVWQRGPAAID